MTPACLPATYQRFKFPACADLVFQTDVLSESLTLRLYHPVFGQVEITKSTAPNGLFTLSTADLPPMVLNPWTGPWMVGFIYEGSLYEHFLYEGEKVGIEIEAQRWLLPPDSYTFFGFKVELEGEDVTEPPDDEHSLIWQNNDIWNNSDIFLIN